MSGGDKAISSTSPRKLSMGANLIESVGSRKLSAARSSKSSSVMKRKGTRKLPSLLKVVENMVKSPLWGSLLTMITAFGESWASITLDILSTNEQFPRLTKMTLPLASLNSPLVKGLQALTRSS